jgi:hypothetical protein
MTKMPSIRADKYHGRPAKASEVCANPTTSLSTFALCD